MSKEVKILETPPPGHAGEGFFATKLDSLIGMARANSLWPLPFAVAESSLWR